MGVSPLSPYCIQTRILLPFLTVTEDSRRKQSFKDDPEAVLRWGTGGARHGFKPPCSILFWQSEIISWRCMHVHLGSAVLAAGHSLNDKFSFWMRAGAMILGASRVKTEIKFLNYKPKLLPLGLLIWHSVIFLRVICKLQEVTSFLSSSIVAKNTQNPSFNNSWWGSSPSPGSLDGALSGTGCLFFLLHESKRLS